LDGSATEIVLDENGVCNFCHQATKALKENIDNCQDNMDEIENIKSKGKYDCLIGLSGGVDSSYMLHMAVQLGLRPLCFSIDNGYNNPKADENIMRLVEGLKVPFYRYNIDLAKFTDLQKAFIKAGLINIEIPTDHILMASSYELASKYGIKTILSGGNVATESIMPASWSYNARDLTHIKDVYKKMTGKKLTGLPTCSLLKWNWYRWVKGIKIFYLLDCFRYNREDAIKELTKLYGFQTTGEKHEENYFTQWFQNYYLFTKFSIDKRKAHYASMINSGQMTRDQAIEKLGYCPVYPEFGIEEKVLKYKKRRHEDFKTDKWYGRIAKVIKLFV
jgi:N-acetyl sugar amidotransferase